MLAWPIPDCDRVYGKFLHYKYELENGTTIVVDEIDDNKLTLENLTPNTRYNFRVCFVTDVGESPFNAEKIFITAQDGR